MKKLLYTFLLGLVVISCDKESLEAPISSQEIAEISNIDLTQRFNAFNDLVSGIKLDKNNPSASKGGDNGIDWIELAWFGSESEGYVYLRPEDLGSGCYGNIHSSISNLQVETYTFDADGGRVNIQIGDSEGTWFNLPASLVERYTQVFASNASSIFFADYADSAWGVRFGGIPSVTINN